MSIDSNRISRYSENLKPENHKYDIKEYTKSLHLPPSKIWLKEKLIVRQQYWLLDGMKIKIGICGEKIYYTQIKVQRIKT